MSLRQDAILRARQYWAMRPIFIDTETTGLQGTAEVIDISVVDHEGQVLLDRLVRPKRTIPQDVIWVHGITNEMVREAPTWPEVWPEVFATLRGRYVGVYNADFDERMLRQSHALYGLAWPANELRFFCIMKLYAQFTGTGRWQKLDAVGRQLGIGLKNTHRAKDDALLARAVMAYMARAG